jgi:hypothetical protein
MTPLIDHQQGKIVYGAPLAYWELEDSFDTAAQCKRQLETDIRMMRQLVQSNRLKEAQQERYEAQTDAQMKWQPGTARKNRDMGLSAAESAKCIASDDPRLKEK